MITIHQRNQEFPMMMTLSANLLKIHFLEFCQTNLSLTGSQFSLFCVCLFSSPYSSIHKYSTVQKIQCSAFTGDKQFTNGQISNIQCHLCPNFLCEVYPSSLPNLANNQTEKFLVLRSHIGCQCNVAWMFWMKTRFAWVV